jgi:hypothetical protein
MIEEAMKEQQKIDRAADIDMRAALLLDPQTGFADKFEAVMTDLLEGNHITQTDLDAEGLYREPTDHESESTDEF